MAAVSVAGKPNDDGARTVTFVRRCEIGVHRACNLLPAPMTHASTPGGNATDSRAQALRAAEERAQERARLLERQSSPLNTPDERIRLWENLHALTLPRASAHPLLALIAAQTALTLEQVRDEQRRRASLALEHR